MQRCGEGRFGTVYEARESPVGARVAIYVLNRALLARPDAAERFEQWALSSASLRHTHLAEIRSVGTHEGVPFFISELPDAETLQARLSRLGSLSLPLLADVMLPVVSVVAASHRRNARQRATPYGVFLVVGDDGALTARVVGYSIAEALAADTDGSPVDPTLLLPFLAPEEARGSKTVDLRSDLWSLGALIYTAATGCRPYVEATREAVLAAMLTRPPVPARELRPLLPVAFEALLTRALERDPNARFASAGDLGRALLPFASAGARERWSAEFGSSPAIVEPPRHVPTRPPPAMPMTAVAPRSSAPPTREMRQTHLRRVPMFATLPNADVENLLACVRWRALGPGETLYRQGESGDTMAFIAEGAISVLAQRGDAQHEVARLGVGSILGEMSCLDPAPRSATLVAAESVIVGELSRDGLDALTAHAPAIAALIVGEVIRHVAAKIRDVEERIEVVLSPPGRPSTKTPPPGGSVEQKGAAEQGAPGASGKPARANSGVWRFVDLLRRIT